MCCLHFQGQVLCMSRLEETVCDADFVFECIPEDLEMKKDLFESMYLISLNEKSY